jgi:nitrite reductase/ring-hydroxylating ferredoxin subunit
MSEFVRVAGTADIPRRQCRVFEVAGKQVAVFHCDGSFFAIDNACKHQGGPLGEGLLEGFVVACPWHGWTYDVRTGISPEDPECAVQRYEVRIEGDDLLIEV